MADIALKIFFFCLIWLMLAATFVITWAGIKGAIKFQREQDEVRAINNIRNINDKQGES